MKWRTGKFVRTTALASLLASASVMGGCGGGCDCAPAPGPAPGESQVVTARPSTLAALEIVPRRTTDSTGSTTFVTGPGIPPMGVGSVEFAIGPNGDGAEELRFTGYHGVRLDELTSLSYWTYVQSSMGDQAVYIILLLDWNNDGTQDDLLFFEPEYQSGYTLAVPAQGPLALSTWQFWNARAGGWWSVNDPAQPPGAGVNTIDAYLLLHPDATIVPSSTGLGGLRFVTGFGAGAWDNFIGNLDAASIGVNGEVTIYDFEP